jgi:transposase-like protein
MECIYHLKEDSPQAKSDHQILKHAVICSGSFLRRSDGIRVQRFLCKTCRKSFSTESLSPLKYQKKRHLNDLVFSLLASGNSQRRIAKLMTVNQKTIVRKFVLFGKICLQDMQSKKHLPSRSIQQFCFDDMETFEHTKCKPLSITLAVEEKTRVILDFRVSSMKAKGYLSQKARKKYGNRIDERKNNLYDLMRNLKKITTDTSLIKSDMNPHYFIPVRKTFPESRYQVYKGRRGCVVGQGELKGGGFDPLFSLNHTCAMLRANINRLFRRTWNTTKKAICLSYHIAIYIFFHNFRLLDQESP